MYGNFGELGPRFIKQNNGGPLLEKQKIPCVYSCLSLSVVAVGESCIHFANLTILV